ncbi:MAG: (2Fe-2S)-binding protein [Nevskiaceae bacterium]|nr:MAG: (2Fe-2S)-binding protein [Nevskiaceae bacterium]TBR73106.1 MAG: (2Fe-2S)-binding protein [Nevskiaceae bacterium]
MYVCVCRAINERKLRETVRAGACTVRSVNQCTGLGSACGRCVPCAREIIDDEQQRLQAASCSASVSAPVAAATA